MEPVDPTFDRPQPTRIIGRKEVMDRTDLKKSTMYTLIRKGKFPKQVKLTDGRVGWDESEIESWIQSRKAGRPWPSTGNELPVPSKPPTVRRMGSAAAIPNQLHSFPQLKRLTIHDLKQLTGRAVVALKSADPEYLFDPATEIVWLQKIGELTLENDFLEGALTKAGLLSVKR
jgi:prophage regulatory protein